MSVRAAASRAADVPDRNDHHPFCEKCAIFSCTVYWNTRPLDRARAARGIRGVCPGANGHPATNPGRNRSSHTGERGNPRFRLRKDARPRQAAHRRIIPTSQEVDRSRQRRRASRSPNGADREPGLGRAHVQALDGAPRTATRGGEFAPATGRPPGPTSAAPRRSVPSSDPPACRRTMRAQARDRVRSACSPKPIPRSCHWPGQARCGRPTAAPVSRAPPRPARRARSLPRASAAATTRPKGRRARPTGSPPSGTARPRSIPA